MRTPIMLVTGSLGSGKTTLLRRILDQSAARLAILMNEFGEIAIDSKVIQGENVQIVEVAGGCVCCSMTGEFEAAIREILAVVSPEVIIVEATGVAEADALVFEVEDNLPEVRLDSVVCIVDAYVSIRHPFVGYTTRTHLEAADIILVNKVDLITEEEVEQVEAQVRQFNPEALLLRTVDCDVDIERLFGIASSRKSRPQVAHAHQAEFASFAFSTERPLDGECFEALAAALPEGIIRAKGFVRFTDSGRLFNYVVGRIDFEDFPADRTELVFIGRNIEGIREELLERLSACEVDHAL